MICISIFENSCIFDLSDHPGVDSSGQIEKFQEKALMELQDYVQKTYPDDSYRYISTSNVKCQFNDCFSCVCCYCTSVPQYHCKRGLSLNVPHCCRW